MSIGPTVMVTDNYHVLDTQLYPWLVQMVYTPDANNTRYMNDSEGSYIFKCVEELVELLIFFYEYGMCAFLIQMDYDMREIE
jgi:hypothetical protein